MDYAIFIERWNKDLGQQIPLHLNSYGRKLHNVQATRNVFKVGISMALRPKKDTLLNGL